MSLLSHEVHKSNYPIYLMVLVGLYASLCWAARVSFNTDRLLGIQNAKSLIFMGES